MNFLLFIVTALIFQNAYSNDFNKCKKLLLKSHRLQAKKGIKIPLNVHLAHHFNLNKSEFLYSLKGGLFSQERLSLYRALGINFEDFSERYFTPEELPQYSELLINHIQIQAKNKISIEQRKKYYRTVFESDDEFFSKNFKNNSPPLLESLKLISEGNSYLTAPHWIGEDTKPIKKVVETVGLQSIPFHQINHMIQDLLYPEYVEYQKRLASIYINEIKRDPSLLSMENRKLERIRWKYVSEQLIIWNKKRKLSEFLNFIGIDPKVGEFNNTFQMYNYLKILKESERNEIITKSISSLPNFIEILGPQAFDTIIYMKSTALRDMGKNETMGLLSPLYNLLAVRQGYLNTKNKSLAYYLDSASRYLVFLIQLSKTDLEDHMSEEIIYGLERNSPLYHLFCSSKVFTQKLMLQIGCSKI